MNIIADSLTLARGVLVLCILIIGITHGVKSLPTIAILTILCWITDVLDGKLASQSLKPTRFGRFDLAADIGLTIALALCLILWEIIPAFPAIIVLIIALLSSIFFQFSAPRKLAMGLVYGLFTLSLWQRDPSWVWVVFGGSVLLVFINPEGSKRQESDFLSEVGSAFKNDKPKL